MGNCGCFEGVCGGGGSIGAPPPKGPQPGKKIVLVDMDNTIADFNKRALELLEERHGLIIDSETLTQWAFADNFPGHRDEVLNLLKEKNFFRSFEPIEGAVEALKEMQADPAVEVYLCTAPIRANPHCASEKLDWVSEHLGADWRGRTVITSDKGLVYGDILIDDAPEAKAKKKKPDWEHVWFSRPFNTMLTGKRRLDRWSDWREVIGVKDTRTVMLTYGGEPRSMGKIGSFDAPLGWFGFKCQCLDQEAKDAFSGLLEESTTMKAAVTKKFPIPQFKAGSTTGGTVLDEIRRLDSLMTAPNQPDKVPIITELMEPQRGFPQFISQGKSYYLYGPFESSDDLLQQLKNDPMLKPVYDKWSKFEKSSIDGATGYGRLYLQIRWEGWFVRPVLEMTDAEFTKLLGDAKAAKVHP